MKITYIDVNLIHINPTANLLPVLIRQHFPDVKMYGPGYSTNDELALGLQRWLDREGGCDVIIIGANIPLLSDHASADNAAIKFFRRYTVHNIRENDIRMGLADIRGAIAKVDIPVKLISTLNFDSYAATKEQVDIIMSAGLGILGPNAQFVRKLEDWPAFSSQEKHYKKKKDRLSDVWYEFLKDNQDRVLTATHFIDGHEANYRPLDNRIWDIAVPGAEYLLRKNAIRNLSCTHLRVAGKKYFHLFRVLDRLYFPVYSSDYTLNLYHSLFHKTISNTRFVYTTSGGSGNMARKYMEIPGAGAVLVCKPCNGFKDIGFIEGRDYILAEPKALADVIHGLIDDDSMQKVAHSGQNLIIRKHSLYARGEQIERGLTAMLKGNFRSAVWEQGEYVVNA